MNHNSDKDFFESLALNVINKYDYLKIDNFLHKDSPDWQNSINSIGIEVTRDERGKKFWADLKNVDKPIPDNKINKFNNKFEKNGGRVISLKQAKIIFQNDSLKDSFGFNDNYFYIIPVYEDNFDMINEIIEKKSKRLNDKYKTFKSNRLFIFTPILASEEMVNKELENISIIQDKYNINFDIIYICLINELYIFDLQNNCIRKIEINLKSCY